VLLTYVDESYTKDQYYIAAVLVPDGEAIPLTDALDKVVESAAKKFPDAGLSREAELHGYDIFQGSGDWAPLKRMLRARIGVYTDALQAIADRDVRIIIRGVHCQRLRQRYTRPAHPHSVVLTHLLERIDECAEKHSERALVIADEPGQHDQQLEYRTDLRLYQSHGTWGYRSRKIERIVDTLHFAPSVASRLVQAADLVAFMYRRIKTSSAGTDPRSVRANAKLWSLLAGRIEHCSRWDP